MEQTTATTAQAEVSKESGSEVTRPSRLRPSPRALSHLGFAGASAALSPTSQPLAYFGGLASLSPNSPDAHAVAAQGVAGPGSAVPGSVAQRFSSGTGVDLSGAREYTGPAAAAACSTLGVAGFTLGSQVAYGSSSPSDHVRFHELAHVAQNSSGVQGFGTGQSDLEANAETVAHALMAGRPAKVTRGGGGLAYFTPLPDITDEEAMRREEEEVAATRQLTVDALCEDIVALADSKDRTKKQRRKRTLSAAAILGSLAGLDSATIAAACRLAREASQAGYEALLAELGHGEVARTHPRVARAVMAAHDLAALEEQLVAWVDTAPFTALLGSTLLGEEGRAAFALAHKAKLDAALTDTDRAACDLDVIHKADEGKREAETKRREGVTSDREATSLALAADRVRLGNEAVDGLAAEVHEAVQAGQALAALQRLAGAPDDLLRLVVRQLDGQGRVSQMFGALSFDERWNVGKAALVRVLGARAPEANLADARALLGLDPAKATERFRSALVADAKDKEPGKSKKKSDGLTSADAFAVLHLLRALPDAQRNLFEATYPELVYKVRQNLNASMRAADDSAGFGAGGGGKKAAAGVMQALASEQLWLQDAPAKLEMQLQMAVRTSQRHLVLARLGELEAAGQLAAIYANPERRGAIEQGLGRAPAAELTRQQWLGAVSETQRISEENQGPASYKGWGVRSSLAGVMNRGRRAAKRERREGRAHVGEKKPRRLLNQVFNKKDGLDAENLALDERSAEGLINSSFVNGGEIDFRDYGEDGIRTRRSRKGQSHEDEDTNRADIAFDVNEGVLQLEVPTLDLVKLRYPFGDMMFDVGPSVLEGVQVRVTWPTQHNPGQAASIHVEAASMALSDIFVTTPASVIGIKTLATGRVEFTQAEPGLAFDKAPATADLMALISERNPARGILGYVFSIDSEDWAIKDTAALAAAFTSLPAGAIGGQSLFVESLTAEGFAVAGGAYASKIVVTGLDLSWDSRPSVTAAKRREQLATLLDKARAELSAATDARARASLEHRISGYEAEDARLAAARPGYLKLEAAYQALYELQTLDARAGKDLDQATRGQLERDARGLAKAAGVAGADTAPLGDLAAVIQDRLDRDAGLVASVGSVVVSDMESGDTKLGSARVEGVALVATGDATQDAMDLAMSTALGQAGEQTTGPRDGSLKLDVGSAAASGVKSAYGDAETIGVQDVQLAWDSRPSVTAETRLAQLRRMAAESQAELDGLPAAAETDSEEAKHERERLADEVARWTADAQTLAAKLPQWRELEAAYRGLMESEALGGREAAIERARAIAAVFGIEGAADVSPETLECELREQIEADAGVIAHVGEISLGGVDAWGTKVAKVKASGVDVAAIGDGAGMAVDDAVSYALGRTSPGAGEASQMNVDAHIREVGATGISVDMGADAAPVTIGGATFSGIDYSTRRDQQGVDTAGAASQHLGGADNDLIVGEVEVSDIDLGAASIGRVGATGVGLDATLAASTPEGGLAALAKLPQSITDGGAQVETVSVEDIRIKGTYTYAAEAKAKLLKERAQIQAELEAETDPTRLQELRECVVAIDAEIAGLQLPSPERTQALADFDTWVQSQEGALGPEYFRGASASSLQEQIDAIDDATKDGAPQKGKASERLRLLEAGVPKTEARIGVLETWMPRAEQAVIDARYSGSAKKEANAQLRLEAMQKELKELKGILPLAKTTLEAARTALGDLDKVAQKRRERRATLVSKLALYKTIVARAEAAGLKATKSQDPHKLSAFQLGQWARTDHIGAQDFTIAEVSGRGLTLDLMDTDTETLGLEIAGGAFESVAVKGVKQGDHQVVDDFMLESGSTLGSDGKAQGKDGVHGFTVASVPLKGLSWKSPGMELEGVGTVTLSTVTIHSRLGLDGNPLKIDKLTIAKAEAPGLSVVYGDMLIDLGRAKDPKAPPTVLEGISLEGLDLHTMAFQLDVDKGEANALNIDLGGGMEVWAQQLRMGGMSIGMVVDEAYAKELRAKGEPVSANRFTLSMASFGGKGVGGKVAGMGPINVERLSGGKLGKFEMDLATGAMEFSGVGVGSLTMGAIDYVGEGLEAHLPRGTSLKGLSVSGRIVPGKTEDDESVLVFDHIGAKRGDFAGLDLVMGSGEGKRTTKIASGYVEGLVVEAFDTSTATLKASTKDIGLLGVSSVADGKEVGGNLFAKALSFEKAIDAATGEDVLKAGFTGVSADHLKTGVDLVKGETGFSGLSGAVEHRTGKDGDSQTTVDVGLGSFGPVSVDWRGGGNRVYGEALTLTDAKASVEITQRTKMVEGMPLPATDIRVPLVDIKAIDGDVTYQAGGLVVRAQDLGIRDVKLTNLEVIDGVMKSARLDVGTLGGDEGLAAHVLQGALDIDSKIGAKGLKFTYDEGRILTTVNELDVDDVVVTKEGDNSKLRADLPKAHIQALTAEIGKYGVESFDKFGNPTQTLLPGTRFRVAVLEAPEGGWLTYEWTPDPNALETPTNEKTVAELDKIKADEAKGNKAQRKKRDKMRRDEELADLLALVNGHITATLDPDGFPAGVVGWPTITVPITNGVADLDGVAVWGGAALTIDKWEDDEGRLQVGIDWLDAGLFGGGYVLAEQDPRSFEEMQRDMAGPDASTYWDTKLQDIIATQGTLFSDTAVSKLPYYETVTRLRKEIKHLEDHEPPGDRKWYRDKLAGKQKSLERAITAHNQYAAAKREGRLEEIAKLERELEEIHEQHRAEGDQMLEMYKASAEQAEAEGRHEEARWWRQQYLTIERHRAGEIAAKQGEILDKRTPAARGKEDPIHLRLRSLDASLHFGDGSGSLIPFHGLMIGARDLGVDFRPVRPPESYESIFTIRGAEVGAQDGSWNVKVDRLDAEIDLPGLLPNGYLDLLGHDGRNNDIANPFTAVLRTGARLEDAEVLLKKPTKVEE